MLAYRLLSKGKQVIYWRQTGIFYTFHGFDKKETNRLELSWTPTKVTSTWNSQPWCPFGIIRVGSNSVTPPIQLDTIVAKSEEDDDGGECRTSIHGSLG